MRRFFLRLLEPLRRQTAERELAREIASHLQLLQDDFERRGLSPDEAYTAARRVYGGIQQSKELQREVRGLPLLDRFLNDFRYAARVLAKTPGFSFVAVLTIALGVGATTAIFSVVDATLLHPLPYPQPDQLVSIEDDFPGIGVRDARMSVPEWQDLQRSGIFEYVSPLGGGSVNLTGSSQPARIRFMAMPPNYFALLGVKAQLGRTFNPDDRTPGFNLEVVISDALWKQSFAGDPHILGKTLRLDNDLYHIIGVMPPGFHDPGRTAEERNNALWAATGFAADPAPPPLRKTRILSPTIGRLKSGLTIPQAQDRLNALVASLQKQFPEDYPANAAWTVRLTPLKEIVVGSVRQPLILLLAAVSVVLLIGCVNLANLLLARSSARAREMAVRQALGAAQSRLITQLLTESSLLSLTGGIAGLVILFGAKAFLLRIVPDTLPRLNDVALNGSVLLFALLSSVVAGILFGLAPALHAGRLNVTHILKREGRGSTASGEQTRTRRALVVTEFALSLVLMIAAGLLLRSFWDLLKVPLGFRPQNVIAINVWLPIPNDPQTDIYRSAAQEAVFLRELLRRGKALPEVEELAISNRAGIPLGHDQNDRNRLPLILEGQEVPANQAPLIDFANVTPGYFHLLGMPLQRGRLFNEFDNDKAPSVAVINQAFVTTYCPHRDPIGMRLRLPAPGHPSSFVWSTIIGVIANARTESLAEPATPELYLNLYQRPAKDLALFLRGTLGAAAALVDVRRQVQSIDAELPVFDAHTLNELLSGSLSQRRFSMQMVGLFALTALLMAGLGIYGVISYLVAERTHEIGIRLALGAETRNILRLILREGLGLAATGAVAGLAFALLLSRLMAGLLYGVTATDAATFLGVPAFLIIIALIASYLPARRALRVDPLVALRYE
jgi:putative ABC transport system permease protein